MRIWQFVARRMLLLIPVLIGVTALVFFISRVIPVDPVVAIIGPRISKEALDHLRAAWGLDKPLYVQYLLYIKGILQGDFGTSIATNRPVLDEIAERFPATLELGLVSAILIIVVGVPSGVVAALNKDRLADHIVRVIALTGVSIPVFWFGLVMILVFNARLGILPSCGRLDILNDAPRQVTGLYILDSLLTRNWVTLKDSVLHIVMPAITLAVQYVAILARVGRASVLNVMGEEYIRVARAKGLPEHMVIYRHALRNAMIPLLTMSGVIFGQLIAGAVITETVFSWPGIGTYVVDSIFRLDFQPTLGFTVLVSFAYVTMNLVVDILYVVADPRITYA